MKRNTVKLLIGFIAFTMGVVSVAFWLFCTPAIFEKVSNIPQKELVTNQDYEVYSALIKELIIKENSSTESINISNQAPFFDAESVVADSEPQFKTFTTDEYVKDLKESYPKVDDEALLDFANKKPSKLYPKFNLPIKYNLVDERKLKENEGLASKQVISFSRVGFNKTKTQAFVRIYYYCGLCGFISNVHLEKQDDVWQIKEEFISLIS